MTERTEIERQQVEYTTLSGQTFIQIWAGKLYRETGYEKYYSNSRYNNGVVVFENVEVTTHVFAFGHANENMLWDVVLINCKLKDLQIRNTHLGNVVIKNTTIEKFSLENSSITNLEVLENSSIKNGVHFEKSTIKNIKIERSTFAFYILKDCVIEEVKMLYATIKAGLSFVFCKLNIFIINRCVIHAADINDLELKYAAYFIHCEISNLVCNLIKPQKLSFDGVSIFQLHLYRRVIHKDIILEFNDCEIANIDFDSIQNFGNIYFKNILPLEWWKTPRKREQESIHKAKRKEAEKEFIPKETRITIQNSDIGKTSFIDCNLRLFSRFEFLNSKMLELFIAGSEMPEEIYAPEGYPAKLLEQQRLGYSQFKSIYEKQGDNIRAWNYKAKELETYRLQLRQQKTFNNLPERFNLGVLKLTSYYNTSWFRPLIFTLAIALILFTAYCFLLGNTLGKDYSLFWKNFSFIGEFINPIHKAETLENNLRVFPENSISVSMARFVNYLSRIIIAFMVYETIQSFRRHGRRIH